MNRFKTLTKQVHHYLIRVHCQFKERKLSFPEMIQFFQDSVDSGYYIIANDWELTHTIHSFRDEKLITMPIDIIDINNIKTQNPDGYFEN